MWHVYMICGFGHKYTNFSGAVTPRARPRLDGRIVGGVPVNIEDYPYQVKLRFFTYKKDFINSKFLTN